MVKGDEIASFGLTVRTMKPMTILALAVIAAGCAGRNYDESHLAFDETPAALRIAFEKDHPTAEVSSVRKMELPNGGMRWTIRYKEDGELGREVYSTDEEPEESD